MPRPPRPTAAGIYHVAVTAPSAGKLFADAEDRLRFTAELARTTLFEHWTCICFCLLTTHYHLVVDVDDGALPRTMKKLNWQYARSVNARREGRGHVVGGRYLSVPVSDTDHLLTVFRYVARNPVEAGLCRQPQAWPWSSYAGSVGLERGFTFVDSAIVLESFAGRVESLRDFVEGV